MHITIVLICTYIACCIRIGAAPWRYFQLNARYFSAEQGIFSKLSLDALIPEQWRLHQVPDAPHVTPTRYPVFMKPEWGQNAHGIHRVDNYSTLQQIRQSLKELDGEQTYIVQESAPGLREFEIFSIDESKHDGRHDVITVTEAVNTTEAYPINSKYNRNTRYADVTSEFSSEELAVLGNYLDQVGLFAISRMSVRADSFEALLAGQFHVIEVNLFLPMPINLLDTSYTWQVRFGFITRAMMSLARATKAIKPVSKPQPIFTRMMLYGRKRSSVRANSELPTRRSLQ